MTMFNIVGGYNGAERLNDMHEYSFATSLWTQLDVSSGDVIDWAYEWREAQINNLRNHQVPSGRSSLISQVYGNTLFIFGGPKQWTCYEIVNVFFFTGYNGANVLNDFYEFRFEPVLIPPPTLVLVRV